MDTASVIPRCRGPVWQARAGVIPTFKAHGNAVPLPCGWRVDSHAGVFCQIVSIVTARIHRYIDGNVNFFIRKLAIVVPVPYKRVTD